MIYLVSGCIVVEKSIKEKFDDIKESISDIQEETVGTWQRTEQMNKNRIQRH